VDLWGTAMIKLCFEDCLPATETEKFQEFRYDDSQFRILSLRPVRSEVDPGFLLWHLGMALALL